MPTWFVWAGALILPIVAVVSMSVLLTLFGGGNEQDKIRLEIVKLAGSIVVGTGGFAALILAARRQLFAELDLAHKERAATNTKHDADERRITDLYTAAAEQLGSDKAPVRMAALFALERLAHINLDHRQTIVDLLCAYLRMPFTHPDASTPSRSDDSTDKHAEQTPPAQQPLLLDLTPTLATAIGFNLHSADQQHQELQVRLTAQRIIAKHLRPDNDEGPNESTRNRFWDRLDLDLTGAVLVDFDLTDCHVSRSWFTGAHFHGPAAFVRAHFHKPAQFGGSHFGNAANFTNAHFHKFANFSSAYFYDWAGFERAHFHEGAGFIFAHFRSWAGFEGAHFHARSGFLHARFHKHTMFEDAYFCNRPTFRYARRRWDSDTSTDTWPDGWMIQPPETDLDGKINGLNGTWWYLVEAPSSQQGKDETGRSI